VTGSGEFFRPIIGRRTFEEAIDQIAYAVHVGDLKVGDRLPAERQLAARMEISRPTLREAIAVLAQAGIVTVALGSRGGTIIKSDSVPAHLLDRGVQTRVSEVAHVLEARRLFEPQVAQLAASYATSEDFVRLRHTIDGQRSAHDRDELGKWDERFHIALARATRNPAVVQIMRDLLRKLPIAWDMEHDVDLGTGMHERTIEALISKDPDAIDAVMDEHLSILEQLWEGEAGRPALRHPARRTGSSLDGGLLAP
jgi:GntR family transcriptional regulator, transcriptional repressor for pyruvate dehydrogenase complex